MSPYASHVNQFVFIDGDWIARHSITPPVEVKLPRWTTLQAVRDKMRAVVDSEKIAMGKRVEVVWIKMKKRENDEEMSSAVEEMVHRSHYSCAVVQREYCDGGGGGSALP